jgi:ABC-type transport system involved in cytochrome c biogenesis permease subunit
MFCLTMGLITFVVMVYRAKHPSVGLNRAWTFFRICLYATCIVHASAYALHWYIAGRIPLGNGYETMLFLALVLLVLSILLHRRLSFILPFGFLLTGFALLVAWLGQRNPQITPLMPVLQSPILASHVSIIMMAYALMAFMMLNGIFALFTDQMHRQQLTVLSRLMLYPAVFMLSAGIFLGAIWANVSWGKYWSWDPKEVWALITLLIYAVPLHTNSIPVFRRPKVLHAYLIAAFLTVLMTYFGVNYLLGGMHSYA